MKAALIITFITVLAFKSFAEGIYFFQGITNSNIKCLIQYDDNYGNVLYSIEDRESFIFLTSEDTEFSLIKGEETLLTGDGNHKNLTLELDFNSENELSKVTLRNKPLKIIQSICSNLIRTP